MATNPSPAVCAACGAPLAPGAKFCGGCGRASTAPPIPPGGGYAAPPPAAPWAGMTGIGPELVPFAGSPDQAMSRLAAALSQAGAVATGPIPGGFRFRHGAYGARMTGEATVSPDGAGNSVAAITTQFDKNSFWVVGGGALIVNMLFVTMVPLLLLPLIGGFAALYAWLNGSWSDKTRARIMAAARQAAGRVPTGHAAAFHAPPPAPPAPVTPMPFQTPPAAGTSATDRLRDLAAQRDRGLLTPDEFDRAKAAILGQLH